VGEVIPRRAREEGRVVMWVTWEGERGSQR
jgi:hypothetical protein